MPTETGNRANDSEMVRRIAALLVLGPALDANYLAIEANMIAVALATSMVSQLGEEA